MSRPLLTFDLDGVLCRPPFGINPGRGLGKDRVRPGKKNLLWLTERWRYRGRRPMPGAAKAFAALAGEYRCVVVTARAESARSLTEAWLERHLGTVPELFMRPHWRETSAQFKVRMTTELAPLAHFEDDPFTAAWLAEFVPRIFLVDWPRNRHLRAPNIVRIRRLEDAVPHLVPPG